MNIKCLMEKSEAWKRVFIGEEIKKIGIITRGICSLHYSWSYNGSKSNFTKNSSHSYLLDLLTLHTSGIYNFGAKEKWTIGK